MIKNIIFDMGQVLIKFDGEYFISRVGIKDAGDKKLLMREVYKSVEWAMMDRGSISDAEAAELMCRRLPERLHEAVRKLTLEWDRPIMPVEGMADLIKELKESGYGIYLLSNASLKQKEYWRSIPGSEYFDGRVVSAEEKLVKPQPEIYRLICERYDLTPEESVFIDDAPANCEAACLCGLNAVVFHGDQQELRDKLRALGIKCRL